MKTYSRQGGQWKQLLIKNLSFWVKVLVHWNSQLSQISSPFFLCLLGGSNKCVAIFSLDICPASKSRWSLLEEVKFYLWMRTSMCLSLLDLPLLGLNENFSPGYWCLSNTTQQICESRSIKISIPLSWCYPVFPAYQRWWQDLVWLRGSLCITATNNIDISLATVPCMKDAYFPLAVTLVIV